MIDDTVDQPPWVRTRLIGYEGSRWVCHFWFVGWDCISFGLHICLKGNIEIHLPFGFFRIGRSFVPTSVRPLGFNLPKEWPR